MAGARAVTELLFWQRARQWSKTIFERTQVSPFSKDQRLVVQINDSSESVMSNMAEGFGRSTQEEFITFLGYALGSLDETLSHLCAAYDRKYLGKEEFGELYAEGIAIRKDYRRVHPIDGDAPRWRTYGSQTQRLVAPGVGNLRARDRATKTRAVRCQAKSRRIGDQFACTPYLVLSTEYPASVNHQLARAA